MESNFDNREFEQYVKRNADQYRMIPSDKVWKGINNVLHTRRKWYGIGFSVLLLLTAASVTWVMVKYPVSRKQEPVISNNGLNEPKGPSRIAANAPAENISSLSPFKRTVRQTEIQPAILPIAASNSDLLLVAEQRVPESQVTASLDKNTSISAARNQPAVATNPPGALVEASSVIATTDPELSPEMEGPSANRTVKSPEIYLPLSIESVENIYHARKLSQRLTWQFYFTPTVSYRKLSENRSYPKAMAPTTYNLVNYPFASTSDVNRSVTHKADLGLEVGVAAKYPLSKNLKLTGAVQFNINRYDIKAAYVYYGEQATIIDGDNATNSVTTWTNYRNYNGSKSDWLKNFYFSVSAPVGAELRLFGNDKTSFGIAGTVQPTYIIGDRAYLLSTDYKNYAKVPDLIRHINVNTSFETFVTYMNHRTRWQIGPQIRYQVLSSFKKKYPLNENLFDYGIKIGITLYQ